MQILTSPDLAKAWLDYQKERHAHPELYAMVSTGLPNLDDRLGGGMEPGQLVYIGGAQKSGKTTVLKSIAEALGRQGKRFIWFGGEMNTMQTGTLIFSNISGIDRTRIRNPRCVLTLSDWAELESAAAEIETYNGYWTYGFSTLQDIDNTITSVENDGEVVDAILGDYVQLMEQPGFRDPQSELKYISRGLKRLTINHVHAKTKEPRQILVIFAAQFNRASQLTKNINATSFLGSGSLERDGDIGLGVQNVIDPVTGMEAANRKEILFLMGRDYKTDKPLQIGYNGSTATIYDLPEARQQSIDLVDYNWR